MSIVFKKNCFIVVIFFAACNQVAHKNSSTTDKQSAIINVQQSPVKDFSINNNKMHRNIIAGEWMQKCNEGSGHITIFDSLDEEAVIEVNSNQIVISAGIDTNNFHEKKEVKFRYTGPVDLGAGGARLHWSDFSKDSVIAVMAISGEDSANLTWYGFYDTKIKKRVWIYNFDMLVDSNGNATDKNEVKIINCH